MKKLILFFLTLSYTGICQDNPTYQRPPEEIAKLVEMNRLTLSLDVLTWLQTALAYPKIQLMALTPEVVVESTCLPGTFHKDPADQLIVATSRIIGCPVLTEDAKILGYADVQTV